MGPQNSRGFNPRTDVADSDFANIHLDQQAPLIGSVVISTQGRNDRYGAIPEPAQQLLRVMELKQIAKTVGFSRIKPEAKQHICLETPMEEPAWKLMSEKLPKHLQSRFVYQGKKVIVRGLGVLPVHKQMNDLIEWLGHLQGALPLAEQVQR